MSFPGQVSSNLVNKLFSQSGILANQPETSRFVKIRCSELTTQQKYIQLAAIVLTDGLVLASALWIAIRMKRFGNIGFT